MKKQIKRLSPHQNGKVFGVLLAISTIPMILIMFLTVHLSAPAGNSLPTFIFIIFPILYLIFGYITVALSCIVYNFLQKYIGGFEYEAHHG